MRVLFWLLGVAAACAGGAYAVDRRSRRRIADRFLVALRDGTLAVEAYEPAIVGRGFRAEAFRGYVDGRAFVFVAQTDVSATKWSYALAWGDARVTAAWNPVSGEADHPFSQAYVILRRRASRDDGTLN